MVSPAQARPLVRPLKPALRVAIVADLLEEGWPSMDLVADMLAAELSESESRVNASLVRPVFAAAVSRGAAVRPVPPTPQRILHRFWSYPRWIRRQAPAADVYHIVDHSYAHLAHELPTGRVVVTCHDTDAFRALSGDGGNESLLPRMFVKRVLSGLRSAAAVACVSEVTRAELVARGFVEAGRTRVVPNGTHPACTPAPDPAADAAAAALTGPVTGDDLLHVGSAIPRKRIDVLLETLAIVARSRPNVRLWRVGGAFTSAQEKQARDLGVRDRITVLPFLSRTVLAAVYRRAALVLLPSEREGFGLAVVEALACGTPILCSDLPVFREVGGDAVAYSTGGEPAAWAASVTALLDERRNRSAEWAGRRSAGLVRAAAFSWNRNAAAMQDIYAQVASR